MNNEEKYILRNTNYPLLIFIVLQILFVVLCVMSASDFLKGDEIIYGSSASRRLAINIDGLKGVMPGVENNSEVETMNKILLDTVGMNIPTVDFGDIKAKIREDSVRTHYFSDLKIDYFSAIVDVPELKQSYWIFHEHSDDIDNPNLTIDTEYVVMCLANERDKIYPDFDCKSDYGQLTYNVIAKKYLDWFDFDNFFLKVSDDYQKIELVVVGGREYEDEKYVNMVKEKLESLGIYPGIFEYEVVDLVEE